jgi:DNA repair photolyase
MGLWRVIMHYKKYKSILSPQNGMNLYRGCTHGCIYCDSRSKCYQMDHDFEDIEVKINAPELLEAALMKKRHKGMIGTGSMCDPYIPLEQTLRLTRTSLKIIEKHGFGVTVLTKSAKVLDDLELLKSINKQARAVVQMTLTTYDETLCKILEPHVSTTSERFEALKVLHANGIETVVWFDPLLPFINDTEANVRGILQYCIDAKVWGIVFFGIGLTLREGNREYFYEKLDRHFEGLKAKYEKTYGNDYSIQSPNHKHLSALVHRICLENHIEDDPDKVFAFLRSFKEPVKIEQLSLF